MKTIESHLLEIYKGIKKDIPDLHCLTFTVSEFLQQPPWVPRGQTRWLHGFVHIGGKCEEFKNVKELEKLVSDKVSRRIKNEILYRRYDIKEVADD